MSAVGADPNAELRVAREHAKAEQVVKDSGLRWAVLQPSFFMDNPLNYGRDSILGEGKMYGSAGDGKTAYVSTADIAAVAAKVLDAPDDYASKTLVLTGGEALSEQDIASAVGKLLGKDVTYVDLDPEQQRGAMEAQSVPGWIIDTMIGLEGVKRNGWAEAVSPAVADVVGRPPETFPAFLERNRDRLS